MYRSEYFCWHKVILISHVVASFYIPHIPLAKFQHNIVIHFVTVTAAKGTELKRARARIWWLKNCVGDFLPAHSKRSNLAWRPCGHFIFLPNQISLCSLHLHSALPTLQSGYWELHKKISHILLEREQPQFLSFYR